MIERAQRPEGPSPEGGRPAGPFFTEQSRAAFPYHYLVLALRHRRVLVGVPLLAVVVGVVVALLAPVRYTVGASFLPEAEEARSTGLSDLADRLGLGSPALRGAGESSHLFVELLQTRALLEAVVESEYRLGGGGSAERSDRPGLRGDLVAAYRAPGRTRRERVDAAAARLRERLTVGFGPAGIVEFSVAARDPDLAFQVARRMLELVGERHREARRARAAAERAFIGERLLDAEAALLAAEDSLQRFLQRNRRYGNSPELAFEFERRQRRVSLRQQVYVSLAQSLEKAKIEEVRNTPVITLVEPPTVPVRPDSRGIPWKGLAGLWLGGLMAIGWVYWRERPSGEWGRESAGAGPHVDVTAVDELPVVASLPGRTRRASGPGADASSSPTPSPASSAFPSEAAAAPPEERKGGAQG